MNENAEMQTEGEDVATPKEEAAAPEGQAANDAAENAETTAVDERLAALVSELEQAKQEVLYARAEAQNSRRRSEKEVADARAYAVTGFSREILSVSDNLSRALDAIPDSAREDEQWKGLIAGLEATGRELTKVFEKHSIKRIAAMGMALDPNLHQAMVEIPSTDAEPGTVVQEMQAGYTIGERLLRPALVGVAKKPD